MSVLRRLKWSELDAETRRDLLDRDVNHAVSPQLREQISGLVADVRERGDLAVCEALATFDGVEIDPAGLRVTREERERAS
ncbi:MAG: hypothetical protein ACO38D_05425, partial [Ilumatobacteraceae bacterium]